jgi:hypothetical protein
MRIPLFLRFSAGRPSRSAQYPSRVDRAKTCTDERDDTQTRWEIYAVTIDVPASQAVKHDHVASIGDEEKRTGEGDA